MDDILIPDVITPEIGWRVWIAHKNDRGEWGLYSQRSFGRLDEFPLPPHYVWTPRKKFEAVCLKCRYENMKRIHGEDVGTTWLVQHDDAPHHDGQCGIYAFSDREITLQHLRETNRYLLRLPRPHTSLYEFVLGKVALWGKIVQHERGWRAQYAYPYEIFVMSGENHIARSLGKRYGVRATEKLPGNV